MKVLAALTQHVQQRSILWHGLTLILTSLGSHQNQATKWYALLSKKWLRKVLGCSQLEYDVNIPLD